MGRRGELEAYSTRTPPASIAHIKAFVDAGPNSPCLLVAEFLRYHFPQLQSQAIRHFLGQVVVGAPAEEHDVRHGREKIGAKKGKRKERRVTEGDCPPL